MISVLRKLFFWNYARNTWQWDALCVAILIFIFLTPKSWFENTQFRRSHIAQTTIVLGGDVVGTQWDRTEIERQARLVTGRPDVQVTDVRERRDDAGKLIAYEVDIR